MCNLCMDDHPNHLFPHLEESQKLLAQQQPFVLMNPFPQGKNMVEASSSTSMVESIQGPPVPTTNTMVINIYMMNVKAHLSTSSYDYETSKSVKNKKDAANPSTPFQIKKVMGKEMTCIHKGVFKKDSRNPNVRAAQNYSIVQDLAQTPCTMSSLEVLQSFPFKIKVVLSALGATKTSDQGAIIFYPTDLKTCLPHHVPLHILMTYTMKSFT
jgi:hypothetical protein